MHDNVTLLLVDDLEKNLVAMEALLRGPGLRVLMARSGDEALELLLTNEVALALVDVQMPGMDGFELAELMRGSERTKHVPIVFVTAGAEDRKRQFQGYDSGAVDFLYKPIEPHILTNKIAVFVALFRQKQALARMSVLQSAIFNSANFSSIATDAKGVIQIFNVGAERMLGYTAADVVDKITPADISDPQEVIARATALSVELGTPIAPGFEALAFKASRGIEDIYQLTYIRKDGRRLPAVVSVTALRDAQAAIIGYLLIGNDNTARKQMEEEQEKFNKRLCDQQFYTRSLIESNIDAIITTDLQGIITDVNHQMEVLTGCSRNDLIGAPFKSYFTDADRAEAAIKQALSEKKVANCELTVRARDGKETMVSYNAATLYDRDGIVLGVFAAARDVTEQKQASQYARSLIEAALDPLVTISAEGKITDVNEGSVKITGVAREKLIGTDFSDYFTEPEKAREGYKHVFDRGTVTDYPLTIRHTDGHLTDVLYNASVYRDTQGAVLGVFAAARDVTEQKQASQYARSLIEAALDPLVTISAEGKITDVNEGSVKITGVARETLIGTDFSNYFTEPEKARDGYKQVFDRETVTDYPLTIRHADGHVTDVLYNASVYRDTQGAVLGVFAAARDVTEQKKASQYEQSLKEELQNSNHTLAKMNELTSAIVDTTRYPLLVLDAELRVESANQAFYNAFRVPPAATIGRRVYQLGNNQWDIPELRRLLEEILPSNSVFDDFQVTHDFNDIGTRTMLVNARRLHGAQSQPRIVLVLADITEQLRLAKNLKDTADELSRSNAELDQFASVASHDLQEPLRMITSYIELLELKYTALFDDRARGYMGQVTSGAQRMAAMIKAILIYSQIGHQAASFTAFESAVPLQSALANLTNKIQEAEATITEGPLPRINADANQLNQLFQNLLGNALKFRSAKRPLVIHVSAIESETEGTFAVADNGIGMDKEGCGKIFQLFQRLNTAQQYPGTGIGLATCRKILEHHRGRIVVESKPDVGSTFYFTMPK